MTSSKNYQTTHSPSQIESSVRPMSLRKNFVWTLFGNIAYGGAQWGMLIVIAKLGSPEMVGRFALAFALTAPVIMFANLNLRGVLATDAAQRYRFGDYLALRMTTLASAMLVIGLMILVSGYPFELGLVVFAVALAKTSESLSDVYFGLMQKHERMDRIAISFALKGVLSLLALAAGVWLTGNILWGCFGLAAAWVILLVLFDIPSAATVLLSARSTGDTEVDSLRPRWQMSHLMELAWLALPLGVATLLNSLLTNIPRYFIKGELGERELGIFAAMAYVVIVGARVVTALGESASPRLARLYAQQDRSGYRLLLYKMVAIGIFIGIFSFIISFIAGKSLLTLLYRPEYAENLPAFLWIMAAAGIGYVALFLQYGMTAARQFRPQPILLTITAVALTASCAILIPIHGLTGAAMALVIGATVQLVANVYVTSRIISRLQIPVDL